MSESSSVNLIRRAWKKMHPEVELRLTDEEIEKIISDYVGFEDGLFALLSDENCKYFDEGGN